MTSEHSDMSSPVTRGELREELSKLEQKFEQKFVTREELYRDFPTKDDLRNELAKYATKQDLDTWGGALLERMTVEIGRAVRAAMESVRISVNAVDDQYRDLPARVARLEAKVFAPKRRRR